MFLYHQGVSSFRNFFPTAAWDNRRKKLKKAQMQTVVYANGNKCQCGSRTSCPTLTVKWSGANSNEAWPLFLHHVSFPLSDTSKPTCTTLHLDTKNKQVTVETEQHLTRFLVKPPDKKTRKKRRIMSTKVCSVLGKI